MTVAPTGMPVSGLADPADSSSTGTARNSGSSSQPGYDDAQSSAIAPSLPQLTLSILERGWGLISAPGGFYQGNFYDHDRFESHKDATCLCSLGAILKVRDERLDALPASHGWSAQAPVEQAANDAVSLLDEQAREMGYSAVVPANDDGGWEVVERMWTGALAKARAGVAS